MPAASPTAIVIGGGVVGALSAYYLARAGFAVTLLERNADLASEASAANANQLSYSYITPPVAPFILPKLPGILMGLDPVLRLRGLTDPAFWGWAVRALPYLLSNGRFRRTADQIHALHQESRSLMAGFTARHDIKFSYQPAGRLMIYDRAEDVEGSHSNLHDHGLGAYVRKLSYEEALKQEPGLKHREPFAGALFTPADETGDCQAFVRALPPILEKMGVELKTGQGVRRLIRHGARIEGVELENGERLTADITVLSAGVWAPKLLRTAGLNAPIYPVKGYTYELPMKKPPFKASIVDMGLKMVFTPLDASLKVSNGIFFQPMREDDDQKFLDRVQELAKGVYPDLNFDGATLRTGYRPWTPNSLPIVERRLENLYVNIGHGMLGWTMAQATSKRLAELARRHKV